jgi:ketosteroid isomerase-like protein
MASAAKQAIAQVRAEHVCAVNTTDVDLLLKGMTDDVVYIAPEQPPVRGKEALRAFIAPLHGQASLDITMTAESVEVSGAHATEWGSASGLNRAGIVGDPNP